MSDTAPRPTPDPIAELVGLRAWVLHIAARFDELAELPARKRAAEIGRLTERMRHAMMAPHLMEACRRE